jgi:crotonobetainyl-CoA:carnitine CoA-transferase CaiB-like acyl-CoA transferase
MQYRPSMTEPMLAGLRVVDMTQYLSGPTVTRLMAEMGADIVKIEQAPHGDPIRSTLFLTDGRSGYFVQQNRGKKSVCLDFDTIEGRAILDKLIAEADILVENCGPNVLERRGLDYESLAEKHPRLIYASISGFGRKGSYSHKTCFDLIAQSFSGMVNATGEPDRAPMPVGSSYADVVAGVHAFAGIGMSLYHRERTGRGGHIDIAMVDTLFHGHELAVQGASVTKGKWRARRGGRFAALNSPAGVYKGPEGWITLQVMAAQWAGFCRAMQRPELEHDERFGDLKARHKHRDELNEIIEAWMATFPSDAALLARLESERVPCAPVLDAADAIHHPYFIERNMVRTIQDPFMGEVVIPGNPMRFSEQTEELDLQTPCLGEHNSEVLLGLGYTAEQIANLETTGVLHQRSR